MGKEINVGSFKTYYQVWGEGKPFLILHGWGGSSDSYEKLGGLLANQGFQVIIPDLPGFGKSNLPPKAWSVDDYTKFAQDFARALNLQDFYLYGHSFGGRICIKWCGGNNDLKPTALILCGAAGIKPERTLKKVVFEVLAKLGKKICALPGLKKLESLAQKILYKLAREHDYERTSGVMRETFKLVVAEDLRRFLPSIKVDTLLVWGRGDTYVPLKYGEIMAKELPRAKLVIIEGARHGVHLQKPEELVRIILSFIK